MKVSFTKMSGAGNDFVVLGPEFASLAGRAGELAKLLCRRRTSIGADGLLLVETDPEIVMSYYNRDGTRAEFCGNGARCMVRYCALRGLASGEIEFRTDAGTHRGRVVEGAVSIDVPAPVVRKDGTARTGHSYTLVEAGVPHAVILVSRVEEVDVEKLGPEIRNDPAFGDRGANVDFVGGSGEGRFGIRTYERGVEQETLACGSGCVAAAGALRWKKTVSGRVEFRVASGAVLSVVQGAETPEVVALEGPAELVYEGEIEVKELDDV
jgi:diaminopimelate epimerase